jgi:VanZ family protein
MLHPLDVSRDDRDRRVWWVAAGLWAALIFVVSAIPSAGSAGDVELRGAVLHIAEFAVLAALLRQAGVSWRWCLLATVLYGLSDELHQAVVPGRDASVPDLLFDAAGALIGASLPVLRSRRRAA